MINAQSKRYSSNVFLNSVIIMIVILKYVFVKIKVNPIYQLLINSFFLSVLKAFNQHFIWSCNKQAISF